MANSEQDGVAPITRYEHNVDGASKKTTLRQFIPSTGEWANVSAVDNGDSTFSLKTEISALRQVSTVNSTTTPLDASAKFTGEWEDVDKCDFLEIVVFTSHSSATDGAKLFLSSDGGTTAHKTLANTIVGGIGAFSYIIPMTAYNAFKIEYTNGATAQTDFDLRVVCQAGASAQAQAPLGANIDATNSAQLTRAVLASESLDGTFGNLKDRNNNLQISVENHQVDTPIKPLTSFSTNQQNVGTTAVEVSATTGRKTIILKSLSSNAGTIYIGESSAVTSGTGYPIDSGDGVEMELDDTNSVWAIADQASQRIAWLEVV